MNLVEALSKPPKRKAKIPAPRILTLDIETAPSLAYVWRLWDENIPLARLIEASEVLCFAAKWYGSKNVEFYSQFEHGREEMVKQAHRLLSEADIVVHFNGKRFDVPHLNREFLLGELPPPASFRQVDLFLTVRSRFKFVSNKLDHVASQLGLGEKLHEHVDFDLWKRCMDNDASAWKIMEKYNKQDVLLTEKVFDKIREWLGAEYHFGLYSDVEHCCPYCGGLSLTKEGYYYTGASAFQRFSCDNCNGWSRTSKAVRKTTTRAIV